MIRITDVGRLHEWQEAEDSCRLGEPHKLAALLRQRKAIPHVQRLFLAELAEGKVALPTMTEKSNSKLNYEQRARIHDVLETMRKLHEGTRDNAESLASELGFEVVDVTHILAEQRKALIAELARKYGVSEVSIPTIVRRFKKGSPLNRKRQ